MVAWILIAALAADGRTRVTSPAPSRDHTERMLAAFGVQVLHEGMTLALEGGQELRGTAIDVPGDFSSAAFFLVAGALAADQPLLLRNVGVNPTRTGLLDLLQRMGADIRVQPRALGAGVEPAADIDESRVRRAAQRRGAVVLTHCAVRGIERSGGRVAAVIDVIRCARDGAGSGMGGGQLRGEPRDRSE